jgi:hypothetical protein
MALRREAGITLEAPLPLEIPDDERGLPMVLSMRASLAEIMVAAGVDPNTPLEYAVDEFGKVLDRNFGAVGSPGREEASRTIREGFRRRITPPTPRSADKSASVPPMTSR